jgi:hypothetical protein
VIAASVVNSSQRPTSKCLQLAEEEPRRRDGSGEDAMPLDQIVLCEV